MSHIIYIYIYEVTNKMSNKMSPSCKFIIHDYLAKGCKMVSHGDKGGVSAWLAWLA